MPRLSSQTAVLSKAPVRRIPRSIYEPARDVARALAKTQAFERSCRDRKRRWCSPISNAFRDLAGCVCAQFEFTLAAIAQNLRRLAKLVVRSLPAAQAHFA